MQKFTLYCATGAVVLAPFMPAVAVGATSTIYDFTKQTGREPLGGLVEGVNGVFYGTTTRKASGYGAVYSLTQADGTMWQMQVLYSFLGGKDGGPPVGDLVLDPSGALYGVTSGNGKAANWGTVYQLVPPAQGSTVWTKQTLYSFKGKADGGNPIAGLVRGADGTLYGTADVGGNLDAPGGSGTVFMLTPPSAGKTNWVQSVIHTFAGAPDGQGPNAPLLLDPSGVLYGTTGLGGNAGSCSGFGCGTVFQMTPPAPGQTQWTDTVLYSFGADAQLPVGLVEDQKGHLYGAVPFTCGDNGCGEIYKLSPPAHGGTVWKQSVLYTFPSGSPNGSEPDQTLTFGADGTLYGVTKFGGFNGEGIAFKLTPPEGGTGAWSESLLYEFNPYNVPGDGAGPSAALLLTSTDMLLGVTLLGGTKGGVIFALSP